ncbi:MAG: hypothetical protein AAF699_21295 [Pseudomonadota bacterium]
MATMTWATLSAEPLDHLHDGQDPTKVFSSDGFLGELKKAPAERMLNAEMAVFPDSEAERASGNHRNGKSVKTVLT